MSKTESRLDDDLKEAHLGLLEWARYARGGESHLKISPESIIYRLMKFGPHGCAHQSGRVTDEAWSQLAQDTEEAILDLPDMARRVVVSTYTLPEQVRDGVVRHLNRRYKLNMTISGYDKKLKEARIRVAAWLRAVARARMLIAQSKVHIMGIGGNVNQ
jgi:hypothetical protein